MSILIMGLPGSGKSWLAERLRNEILNSVWLNGDDVRREANDWDFSEGGRLSQAARMRSLALEHEQNGNIVICDFIAPTETTRSVFGADKVIWVDTITESIYEDTNQMFESPTNVDFHITKHKSEEDVHNLARVLSKVFKWNKPTVQMLGRFQPWHTSHYELFERCYAKTGQVIIQVRNMREDFDNPFDYSYIRDNIKRELLNKGRHQGIDYEIMQVPNITNITYGRDVGYHIEMETFDEEIHMVSATAIRTQMRMAGEL